MLIEQKVATHYTHGSLEAAILDALRRMDKDPARIAAADLSGVDEFHLGWRPATGELAKDLGLAHGMHVLDVGSGIGGPARHIADVYGCRVTGVDLTDVGKGHPQHAARLLAEDEGLLRCQPHGAADDQHDQTSPDATKRQ